MSIFNDRIRKNPWPLIVILLIAVFVGIRFWQFQSRNGELEIKARNWDKLMLVLGEIDKNYVDSVNYTDITEKVYSTHSGEP